MHIGLIGGIGPAATDYYYRRLIAAFASKGEKLTLTIVHADTPTLLGNLADSRYEAQIKIYSSLTERLVAAEADCVVVTSIAGHFCIEDFTAVSPLPVINMIKEVDQAVGQMGIGKVGILGTRTVMRSRFYGGISSATVIPPEGQTLDEVHEAYVAMAASGVVTPQQKAIFDAACQNLLEDHGAEAIMLGGTDLALAFNPENADFPLIDCAGIHVDAILRRAIPG